MQCYIILGGLQSCPDVGLWVRSSLSSFFPMLRICMYCLVFYHAPFNTISQSINTRLIKDFVSYNALFIILLTPMPQYISTSQPWTTQPAQTLIFLPLYQRNTTIPYTTVAALTYRNTTDFYTNVIPPLIPPIEKLNYFIF